MKSKINHALNLIAFAVLLAIAPAATAETKAKTEPLKDPTALYPAGQVQVEAIAFTDTANLDDYDNGGGAAITYWHWANVGLGFEAKTFDTAHAAFDRLGLNLAARYPIEALGVAGISRIGFDWRAEQVGRDRDRSEFDVYVGLGLEKRIAQVWTIAGELRGVRAAELDPDESVQLLLRVGRVF